MNKTNVRRKMKNMKTLSQISNQLKQEGHTLDFSVNSKGQLYALGNKDKSYEATAVDLLQTYRFEGMSNPSDASILFLLKIPSGETGTLINAYGAESSNDINEFIKNVNQ